MQRSVNQYHIIFTKLLIQEHKNCHIVTTQTLQACQDIWQINIIKYNKVDIKNKIYVILWN